MVALSLDLHYKEVIKVIILFCKISKSRVSVEVNNKRLNRMETSSACAISYRTNPNWCSYESERTTQSSWYDIYVCRLVKVLEPSVNKPNRND